PLQREQREADGDADDDLIRHLVARQQAVVRLPRDLQVVVRESDGSVRQRRQRRNPHVRIPQVRPEQRGHDGRGENEEPAHRRRAGFGTVRVGTVGPDDLADLELAQLADKPRTEHEAEDERRDGGRAGPDRDVPHHVERRHLSAQPRLLVEKVIEHQANSAFSRSTTTSVRTPRDPLTSTRSPGCTYSAKASAAAALLVKYLMRSRGMPAVTAATATASAFRSPI